MYMVFCFSSIMLGLLCPSKLFLEIGAFNMLCAIAFFGMEYLKHWEQGPYEHKLVYGEGWSTSLEFIERSKSILPDNYLMIDLYDSFSWVKDHGIVLPAPDNHHQWNHFKQISKITLPSYKKLMKEDPMLLIVWNDGTIYLQRSDSSYKVLRCTPLPHLTV